jgi:hypothetical protein
MSVRCEVCGQKNPDLIVVVTAFVRCESVDETLNNASAPSSLNVHSKCVRESPAETGISLRQGLRLAVNSI